MVITAPGRSAKFWTSDPISGWPTARVVDLGRISLSPGRVITGQVRDEMGRGVKGVTISARGASRIPRVNTQNNSPFETLSVATTNETGRFALPCASLSAAFLIADAEGYHRKKTLVSDSQENALVILSRGGHVEGRVQTNAGEPLAGYVHLEYGVLDGEIATTSRDGTFKLNLDHPGDYRVVASLEQDGGVVQIRSAILTGPRKGLRLHQPMTTLGPGVRVEAIEAETGKAVREFVTAVAWVKVNSPEATPHHFRHLLLSTSCKNREPGATLVRGPEPGEPETGFIEVAADGYATGVWGPISWNEAKPPHIKVELRKEATISGQVIDELSGEAVPSAEVILESRTAPWTVDDKGKFCITGLSAGRYTIRARGSHVPDSAPSSITVEAGEAKEGVRLVLPAGTTLSGALLGVTPGPEWLARLERTGSGSSPFDYDPLGRRHRTSPVSSDGRFELTRLSPGSYMLKILQPSSANGECWLETNVCSYTIDGEDARQSFDLSRRSPGWITGRVRWAGQGITPAHLAVVAARRGRGKDLLATFLRRETVGWVSPERAFRIDVPPGLYELRVVDLRTGVALCAPIYVTVDAAETTERELELDAVVATVVLPSSLNDIGPTKLGVWSEYQQHHSYGDRSPADGSSIGMLLPTGTREFTLTLPAAPVTLRLHSTRSFLAFDERTAEWPTPVAERRFTPLLEGENRVELELSR